MADKSIGSLSKATSLNDDSLLVVEQQGEARSITGGLVKQYAREATADYAEQAKADADRAAEKAKDAADVAIHPPKIQGGNWWTWDTAKNDYVDSGTDAGVSLTIAETVTGAPGEPAKVENVGTATDPKLKFTIPLGNQGPVLSVNGQQGDVTIGGRNYLSVDPSNWTNGNMASASPVGTPFEETFSTSNRVRRLRYYKLIPISGQFTVSVPEDYQLYFYAFDEAGLYLGRRMDSVEWHDSGVYVSDCPFLAVLLRRKDDGNIVPTDISGVEIKIERGNVATDWTPAPEDYLGPFNIYDVPEMHRNIYRGKNLGDHVTEAQKAAIAAGTWDDLYVGDYWTINGRVYRIADMDYWYNCGDTAFARHHLVIVPDKSIGSAQMNSTNTTEGGYMNSEMRTKNLDGAKAIIKDAFGDLVLSHREIFTNEVKDGYPSGYEWTDSEVDLMNEIMVYGCNVYSAMGNGSIIPAKYTIDNSQLALFALNPRMIKTMGSHWMRDVVSSSKFAFINGAGSAFHTVASGSVGIRPAFAIGVATAADEPVEGPEIMDTYGEEYEEV